MPVANTVNQKRLDEDPPPLSIQYHTCIACNKKYGSIEDVTKHFTLFHKISGKLQNTMIQTGSFS